VNVLLAVNHTTIVTQQHLLHQVPILL
jgi:hypothetical protein